MVHALDHRGQDEARRLGVLVRVHADRELVLLARRLEHAEPGRARGVKDDVGALVVLREPELLALGRILERRAGRARVLHQHLELRVDRRDAGAVAGLELLDERDLHAAHEPDLAGPVEECRERADQVGALLLLEGERREVRGQRIARLHGVVHARELDGGELAGELVDVVREQEADAEHELAAARGELAQRRLAVGALAGLERLDLDPELLPGLLEPGVGGVVEGLVAAPAHVEHEADLERAPRGLAGATRRLRALAAPRGEDGGGGEAQRGAGDRTMRHGALPVVVPGASLAPAAPARSSGGSGPRRGRRRPRPRARHGAACGKCGWRAPRTPCRWRASS